jgi:hypothetical protein
MHSSAGYCSLLMFIVNNWDFLSMKTNRRQTSRKTNIADLNLQLHIGVRCSPLCWVDLLWAMFQNLALLFSPGRMRSWCHIYLILVGQLMIIMQWPSSAVYLCHLALLSKVPVTEIFIWFSWKQEINRWINTPTKNIFLVRLTT